MCLLLVSNGATSYKVHIAHGKSIHHKLTFASQYPRKMSMDSLRRADDNYRGEDLVSPDRMRLRTLLFSAILAIGLATSVNAAVPFLSNTDLPTLSQINTNIFDPSNFQPVCPASDSFYQFSKGFANALVGSENVQEYGPLIASVLLRVRLELCVFESFLYEAVAPFIKQKGLSWILPLHESLETLIAGTVFAVASNFILLGSTKIFTVLLIYFDALLGWPIRFIGGLLQKFSGKDSTPSSVGKAMKIIGDIIGGVRKAVEVIDTFVGRYLVFGTTVYIVIKFAHYKFFNGIIPF